jgi:hypothetical protein
MIGLWIDERVGGHSRLVYCDDCELMQVPPELRKCVCYVGAERGDEPPLIGTAFFVHDPLGVRDVSFVYVVTARHCVRPDDHRENGPFDKTWLRVNARKGGSMRIEIPPERWACHHVADVAVLTLPLDLGVYEYSPYPIRGGATADFIKQHNISAGEDVLITGLLTVHPGKARVLPIVRVGNIAALPEEPIRFQTGDEDLAYLVEVRSLGGLSGSPAFVHLLPVRTTPQGGVTMSSGGGVGLAGRNYLMGVVHGFFRTAENDPDGIGAKGNSGITVVVPIDRVLDIIDSPAFVQLRERERKNLEAEDMPTPATTEEPTEFARFEDLASGLLQVPKDEADEVHRDHQT